MCPFNLTYLNFFKKRRHPQFNTKKMKKIFIFNGVHGSGKSTVAQNIVKMDKRFKYFDEIGKRVREKMGGATVDINKEFDKKVMIEELERDQKLLETEKIPIVETWHIGNIAYIEKRNPDLTREYVEKMLNQMNFIEPCGVIFKIDHQTFKQRMTEKIPPEKLSEYIVFYNSIIYNTLDLYNKYKIPYIIYDNNTNSIDKITRDIINSLNLTI